MSVGEFQRARSPEQQELRRESILATARDMLDRRPPAEVSLRELSRQVGLSKSNVVRYFPTREAVFLAVLTEDWTAYLTALDASLPGVDRRRRVHTQHELVAQAIARTLNEHPRLCDLLVACPTVLEHNVPPRTAREFKAASLVSLTRLAELVRSRTPGLGETESFEFAGITWAFVSGAWPMAHPSPVVADALTEPALAPLAVDFTTAAGRILSVVLDGLTRPR